ncbi:MAG: hypothetical protein HF978_13415 [Desulfobacteraceae bacterium]|nr:hypothetical protein [Desulfobacteraceae bacterium]MBC2756541.1 hypothetical protein [Desulfobacteraceae bacterium]
MKTAKSKINTSCKEITEINTLLVNQIPVSVDSANLFRNIPSFDVSPDKSSIPLRTPEIAVYAGSGVSHSWLWFVEILDRMEFSNVTFLDENDVSSGKLKNIDSLLVSGGETFAIANGLGIKGKKEIIDLLNRGGLYFGACAGACMMLKSTSSDLGLLDLVPARIANIVDELPVPVKPSKKYSSPYGCAWVFHPVRGEVLLKLNSKNGNKNFRSISAPLFGGPPMEVDESTYSVAKYNAFTNSTDYLSTPAVAEEVLLGKTAILMKKYDKGTIVLSGPHLEHPDYPDANKMIAELIFQHIPDKPKVSNCHSEKADHFNSGLLKSLKREISNIRIVSFSLERTPVDWKIGRKYYEPEKIGVYVKTIWDRLNDLEKKLRSAKDNLYNIKDLEKSIVHAEFATKQIRELKNKVNNKEPSDDLAAMLFYNLRKLSICFYNFYFKNKQSNLTDIQKKIALSRKTVWHHQT